MSERISNLINHHFCIKGKYQDKVLKHLNPRFKKSLVFDHTFDWNFLSTEEGENEKRFILFEPTDGWTYMRWNVWDFEPNKSQALALSKELDTAVNYFFIDPWIATLSWVIAKKGEILSSYNESHAEILEQQGEFVPMGNKNKEPEFWEDKYWSFYYKMNLPISVLNHTKNLNAVIGELN